MNTGPIIAIAFFVLLLLLVILRAVWGYVQVSKDAHEEWPDYKKNMPRHAKGINGERFHRAYMRAHAPRGAAYGAVMLVAAAMLTPFIMLILTGLYDVLIAQPFDSSRVTRASFDGEVGRQFRLDGPLVYAFFLFFGLIASWGVIAFTVAHRFHKNRPGSLEDELRIERGDAPLPDAPGGRARPKWSPLVKTEDGLKLPEATNKE
jgi:uncharacterized membrane protein YdbT with pleckstrin-like domain